MMRQHTTRFPFLMILCGSFIAALLGGCWATTATFNEESLGPSFVKVSEDLDRQEFDRLAYEHCQELIGDPDEVVFYVTVSKSRRPFGRSRPIGYFCYAFEDDQIAKYSESIPGFEDTMANVQFDHRKLRNIMILRD